MGSKDRFSNNKLLDDFSYREIQPGQKNIFQEQLGTRVGYGRVYSIIENILEKCGVIAPNLPTKTDDLSHSTGHSWTTREKWSSYDYCLVLDQRCSDFSYYLYFNKVGSSKTGDLVVRSVLSRSTSEIDLDKPFRCPHEADKGSPTLSLNSPRTVT
uniref:Ulp1 protease-like n=1 Tax=Oryza sativa subsp. japonica TaxID=39947 RepID=Q67W91_ORYSJ|nr:Ulp1 protease-like [Oryza sativa Japonica Group]BAD37578.1 Ulp1 protease-like [Oryza sativa Japonica Group]